MGRGRPIKPGISFYRFDSGHILNKKVRLLYNEYNSDGYYIWSCLLDKAYSEWGYYFDMNDLEEMELFAAEYCKKSLTLIREVIAGCIRRGLFDKTVADLFGILTSTMMQETFLVATSERRAKGTPFEMCQEWTLLDFSQEVPPNISIVPVKKRIVPRNNSIVPLKNPQRRVDKKIEEESREEESTPPAGGGEATAPPPDPKEVFKGLEKTKKSLYDFIAAYRPDFIEPYVDLWNIFAATRAKATIIKISDARRKKFKTRIQEKTFDFLAVLTKAGHAGDFLSTSKWFTFDWIMDSEGNYLKVLEGNYDKENPPAPKGDAASLPKLSKDEIDLNYLYERFLEGPELVTVISVYSEHYNVLKKSGHINFSEEVKAEIEQKAAAYLVEKKIASGPEVITKYKKRFGVLEFFKQYQQTGQGAIFYVVNTPA